MSKDDLKKTKTPTKTKGRSFCCSIFIYTFVFISGVVVATILPDLAGHHFKQPYGKEYGVMVEQIFKDLPKHLKSFSETVVVLGRDAIDRVWDLKAQLERQIADMNKKTEHTGKTKTVTQQPKTRTTTKTTNHKDHVHTERAHDTHTASKQTITVTSTLEWVTANPFNIDDRSSQSNEL